MKSTYDLYWDEETTNPSIALTEYIKLHIISLEQDLDLYSSEDSIGYKQTMAGISTSAHILSVAYDILGIQPKETE